MRKENILNLQYVNFSMFKSSKNITHGHQHYK